MPATRYVVSAIRFVGSLLILTSAVTLSTFAQADSIDPTFVPVPSRTFVGDDIASKGLVAQPDGKVIIWGGNFAIDGQAKGQIARLNADGTLDNSFVYCGCLLNAVYSVTVQSDGKLLVSGSNFGQAKISRLNSDGSLDATFASVFDGLQALASYADMAVIQPDGRILVNIVGFYAGGFHGRYVTRLLSTGSTDTGFTNVVYDGGRLITTVLRALALDPSGKMYMSFTTFSGPTQSSSLSRFNADGTTDNKWERPNFSPSGNTYFSGLGVQTDGSLIISGRFDTVNGLAKTNVVRLTPAGNVDLNFTAPVLGSGAGQMAILQSGKILISFSAAGVGQLVRLKADGSIDNTFVLSSTVNSVLNRWELDSSERIYFLGIADTLVYRYFRLNPNGDLDSAYLPNVTLFARVNVLARQADGKLIMAGNFTHMNGSRRPSIARVNADGTLDPSFTSDTGFSSIPRRIIVQGDGKIIAVGSFSMYNGEPRQAIARLNSDGSLDTGFNPLIPASLVIEAVSFQANGMILIAGNFTSVNGTTRTGIARLGADGSLDATFDPIFGNPQLMDIFQQPDGKIMVAGSFSGVNGFNRSGMVRLNDDGSLDQSLNASSIGGILRVYRQPDGKYIYSTTTTVGRRNVDGSADPSFAPPAFDTSGSNGRSIDALVLQPDGTLIVGGRFDLVGGATRRNIVRLTSAGALDPLFAPVGTDAPVRAIIPQPDGKIVVGGEFTAIESVIRSGAARMSVSAFRNAARFDFDGDGRADVAVYRPSSGVWYQLFSGGGPYGSPTFGIAGDIPVPADYDGDGRTDLAIWRPSTGAWWYQLSTTGQLRAATVGMAGDIPLPNDMNNDGTDDFVVFRPSNNTWQWYTTSGAFGQMAFGLAGDKPLIGDFDGDGRGDPAIFRPSSGDWWYAASGSAGAHRFVHWGQNGDIPAAADYDGDGKTDVAVFRPSNGAWYVLKSSDLSYLIIAFGVNGDRPVPADYDGDGRADIAVFRPSTGVWYLMRTTAGTAGVQWGLASDVAIPNAFTQP